LDNFRQDEKKARVRVRQLENDLDHNLKRLDIICKSKGLPRPKRPEVAANIDSRGQRSSNYTSPYG
jgi:hypothetical protein